VQSNIRLFDSKEYNVEKNEMPRITLYRDHAGWCPYCQKTMLLIEEKRIPINIELVPMRSYGDKPADFTRMVQGGMLPAIKVENEKSNQPPQVITESGVIMELLDRWHGKDEGYKPMLPENMDNVGWDKYNSLAKLERELFSWWCTLIFRPEGPRMSAGGIMGMLSGATGGKKSKEMSGAMSGFLDCLGKVDKELTSTPGPWFFSSKDYDYPTMIDFVYVSHVERMLASAAYWKGLNLRSEEMKSKFPGINAWLDAFEKRECYLAFKSDYYTHIKDIPPQYGPGYDGGFEEDRQAFSKSITGMDGTSWVLPLPFDDAVQPLYRGPPLPLAVLESAGITPDADGSGMYEQADPSIMERACRQMAGWKLSGNGEKVATFAARGGSKGANNPRKPFGAELADPYAAADKSIVPYVDAALRVVAEGLLDDGTFAVESEDGDADTHMAFLNTLEPKLQAAVPKEATDDVLASLAYVRDRVGVPRDLPLAAGRQLRAHLNWAIRAL